MNEPITIQVKRADALVLCDLLARFRDGSALRIRHAAERAALWSLTAVLEEALPEPFESGYPQLLEEARRQVCEDYGL